MALALLIIGTMVAICFRKAERPGAPRKQAESQPVASTGAPPVASIETQQLTPVESHLLGSIEPVAASGDAASAPSENGGWIRSAQATESNWPPPLASEYALASTITPIETSHANNGAEATTPFGDAPPSSSDVGGDSPLALVATDESLVSSEHANRVNDDSNDISRFDSPGSLGRFRYHKVSDGDTLSTLAASYLGNSGRFREIYDLNRAMLANPDVLPIGARLRIPIGESAPADAPNEAEDNEGLVPLIEHPTSTASEPARSYRVEAGDSLETIAQRFFGDAGRADDLLEANRDRLNSAADLYEGMLLVLPQISP